MGNEQRAGGGAGLKVPESQKMQELLAELKRIERQQSVLQDAVQNSKTVIAHPRVTATPPETPEKPKEPEDKFIASGGVLLVQWSFAALQSLQSICSRLHVHGIIWYSGHYNLSCPKRSHSSKNIVWHQPTHCRCCKWPTDEAALCCLSHSRIFQAF